MRMRSSPGACRSTPRLARGEGAVEHVHRAETRHAVVVRPGEPARPTRVPRTFAFISTPSSLVEPTVR